MIFFCALSFMNHFLVVNVGSSSVKYALFDEREKLRIREHIEGARDFRLTARRLLRKIGHLEEISATIHRIVHGGDKHEPVAEMTSLLLAHLKNTSELTPLHSPEALEAAEALAEFLPSAKQYAVFDSGFFRGLPRVAQQYALPKQILNHYRIHRLGFHGISHEYACRETAKKIKRPLEKSTFISLHLGSGSSIALIHRGKPLDTSMGFTPLEGLPMMTRSGDVDPGIVLYVLRKCIEERKQASSPNLSSRAEASGAWRSHAVRIRRGLPRRLTPPRNDETFLDSRLHENDQDVIEYLEHLLNQESGLKGLSGLGDFKQLLHAAQADPEARFALDFFMYRIRKYIGSYFAVAPRKPDALVTTGAIGAGDARFRKMLFKNFPLVKGIPIVAIRPNEELAMMRMVKQKFLISKP